jgi:carboxylesterase type B
MVYLGLAMIAATALHVASAASPPTVSIQHGTVIGSTAYGIENFKGIPYAKPPTGDRRLKPAQTLDSDFGTLTATATPTACPQLNSKLDTSLLPAELVKTLGGAISEPATIEGEDCLTLNVQRPSGTNETSKLPVLLWI